MNLTEHDLCTAIEHTILKPEATEDQVLALCDEAIEFQLGGVCVNPCFVGLAVNRLADSDVRVVTVAGFPLGANESAVKAEEARRAVDAGADEVDMVARIGSLAAGDRDTVRDDIAQVAGAVHGGGTGALLKVIIESAALDEQGIVLACRCCAEGEADFVKTSTGMHAAGGASVETVRFIRRHASPLRIKAAGGIRTSDQAAAMMEAGADRIGTSCGPVIVRQWRESATAKSG
jgi:deoxyribose-phosphate aldolase